MGYSIDGGFGEYAVAYGRYVVRVSDGIDPFDAAPLTCAGVTTYKAVKVAGTRSSDLVAVFGVGGLGHLAIQYAAIAGSRRAGPPRAGELSRSICSTPSSSWRGNSGPSSRSTSPRRIPCRRSRHSAEPIKRSL